MYNNLINCIAPLKCEKFCFQPQLKVLSIWQRIFNSDIKKQIAREDFFEQTFKEKLAGENEEKSFNTEEKKTRERKRESS